MMTKKRSFSGNQDFVILVKYLDADLAKRDGEDYSFYAQFNTVAELEYVVVACENGQSTGCGAMKQIAPAPWK